MRRHSFTLSRPGLKPDRHVPLRLRMVDILTVLSTLPFMIAVVGVSMMAGLLAETG